MKLLYLLTLGFFFSASACVFFGNEQFFRHHSTSPTNDTLSAARNKTHKTNGGKAHAKQDKATGSWTYGTSDFTGEQLVTTNIPSAPIVYGVKTVDKSSAAPGETLTYTVTI